MPRPPRKSKLAEARARMYRELVFESAERVFSEQGFAESSMQDVAAEAGISLKTLYATFRGKDDLYRAILAERGQGLLRAMQDPAALEGSAMERLAAGTRAIVAYLLEHRRFFRILLQEGQAWGLDPRGEDARASWRQGIETVRSILEDGIEAGEFLEADPDLLAPTINAVLQVQLAGILDRGVEDPDPEAVSEEILKTLSRLLCGAEEAPSLQAAR